MVQPREPEPLVGQAPAFLDLMEEASRAAPLDRPLLVVGEGAEPLGESGIVLGCLEDFVYRVSRCTIPVNGTLAIYTDGLTESESSSGEYFGTGRLRDSLVKHAGGTAEEICTNVIDEVKSFGSSETQVRS